MILESLTIPVGFDTGLLLEGLDLIKGGFETVVSFLKDSTEEAMEAQEVNAQLEAVLKSTGGAAGVTAEMAQDLASKYQGLTRFSDDAVLSAENMLLTFTSIGKDVFPDALETVLNMSQALGQDLKSSSVQLGKALNDPITGVTALRRVGVQFNDEQQETIKNLVESGNLMEAQTMILKELGKEFGGSAIAAGQTFGGQLDILKNKISDMKERIGGALLPVLTSLADRFSNLIDSPRVQALVDGVVASLEAVGGWIIENLPIWANNFDKFMEAVETFWTTKGKPALTELATWLGINIPGAAEKADKKSATLANTWNTRVSPSVRELIRLYNNLNTILEKLSPSTGGVAGKFTLLGIAQRLAVATATIVNGLLLGLERTLNSLNGGLERVIRRWDDFRNAVYGVINAIAQLSIPWWLIPGSPTPLENGLRGITEAMSEMGNVPMLPQLIPSGNARDVATTTQPVMNEARFAHIIEMAVARQLG